MTLSAQVRSRRGSLELSVDLDVEDEIVAVLGPNGAGKTSLFRVLAGLDALDAGRITLDKVVLDDPTTGEFVRPEARSVGMVFQDYLSRIPGWNGSASAASAMPSPLRSLEAKLSVLHSRGLWSQIRN